MSWCAVPGPSARVVIAVDPGVHRSGVAVLARGRLHAAALVEGSAGAQPRELDALLGEYASEGDGALVVEMPQVYQDRREGNRRQDLVSLAVVVGAWEGEAVRRGWPVTRLLPARWKGQVPKEVTHDRARAVLDADEKAVLARHLARIKTHLRHNVLDAVALLLVHVRRVRMRARG